jgi:hypothetical protein
MTTEPTPDPKPKPKPRAKPKTQNAPETPPPTVIERLSAPFPTKDVRQREGAKGRMLDYVGIDSTIGRLLEVCPDYETSDLSYDIKGPIDTIRKRRDGGEYHVDCFLGTVSLVLHVPTEGGVKRHVGIGADFDDDPDKVLKTALAEALKKAGHQLGLALYLWDEAERATVARQRELQNGSEAALKREVVRLVIAAGVELPTNDPEAAAQKIADHFGVAPADLQDPDVLRRLAGVEA